MKLLFRQSFQILTRISFNRLAAKFILQYFLELSLRLFIIFILGIVRISWKLLCVIYQRFYVGLFIIEFLEIDLGLTKILNNAYLPLSFFKKVSVLGRGIER